MGDWLYMVEIAGPPIGKGRPRGASIGGSVRLYTPKKTADWERSAATIMSSRWRKAPIDGPVEVEIAAFAHRPKRLMRKRDPDHVIYKVSKPDADNICKSALDALVMAGVVRDDSQVVRVTILDCYAERHRGPRLCLRLRMAEPEPESGWWEELPDHMAQPVDCPVEDDLPW